MFCILLSIQAILFLNLTAVYLFGHKVRTCSPLKRGFQYEPDAFVQCTQSVVHLSLKSSLVVATHALLMQEAEGPMDPM